MFHRFIYTLNESGNSAIAKTVSRTDRSDCGKRQRGHFGHLLCCHVKVDGNTLFNLAPVAGPFPVQVVPTRLDCFKCGPIVRPLPILLSHICFDEIKYK